MSPKFQKTLFRVAIPLAVWLGVWQLASWWVGRDLLLRTLKGLSTSMTVGIAASLISAGIAVLVGIASSGVHSNGFSLVRKVFDVEKQDIKTPLEALGGRSIGETLLTPTKIYVKPMLELFKAVRVKGVSHITGGGFYENIPRSIPDGLGAVIDRASVRVLPVFELIEKTGNIPERDMFNTFNMGVGMSLIVSPQEADKALGLLRSLGEEAYAIGHVVKSEDKVRIC